ncbi:hypothetical protein R1sor_010646 [Riccia sorocarpa]|uniref:Pentatricopeptide repeat-containing protein n=1 Tax=Riccia sorocarpa TaxID=122646 RepID=A0ABD3HYM6_9MARC
MDLWPWFTGGHIDVGHCGLQPCLRTLARPLPPSRVPLLLGRIETCVAMDLHPSVNVGLFDNSASTSMVYSRSRRFVSSSQGQQSKFLSCRWQQKENCISRHQFSMSGALESSPVTVRSSTHISAWKEDERSNPSRLLEGDDEGSCCKAPAESDFLNILEIIKGKGHWRYQKVKELKSLRIKVDSTLVLKVIKNENVPPSLAWKFFVWAKKQMGYKNTPETYNAMLQVLCESRKFTSIFFLLEDMHQDGCSLTVETCMKMAKVFGSAGLVERALHALNHMGKLGSPPTSRHYTSLIVALLKSQHYFKAYIVYTEMVRNGCEADSHIFKVLVREFERAGKVDLACQLYDDMLVKGCAPDAETSSALINVLCEAGRVDDAVCLFEKMKCEGIRPNVSRYNTLIVYLGKENKLEKALQLFDELRCRGYVPDHRMLSSLVESLRNCGCDEEAELCSEYSRSQGSPQGEGEE